jgi:nitrogen fixation/metabolism regulation signal transduction histidine kinase
MIELRDAAYDEAIAQMDSEQADASRQFYIAVVTSAVALVLSLFIGMLVPRRVTRPLAVMTDDMARIAGGDLQLPIRGLDRQDEIGAMAKALQVFKEGLQRNQELGLLASQDRSLTEERRKASLAELAATFEASVGGIVGSVAASARDLEVAAGLIAYPGRLFWRGGFGQQ